MVTYTWWLARRWRCLSCEDVSTGMQTDLDRSLTILGAVTISSSLSWSLPFGLELPALPRLVLPLVLPSPAELRRCLSLVWIRCENVPVTEEDDDEPEVAVTPPPADPEALLDDEFDEDRPRRRETSFISRHSIPSQIPTLFHLPFDSSHL